MLVRTSFSSCYWSSNYISYWGHLLIKWCKLSMTYLKENILGEPDRGNYIFYWGHLLIKWCKLSMTYLKKNILGEPDRGLFFIICSASAVRVQSVCGLTQQVRIGRGIAWQGCETSFLSLGPDAISVTLIRLITGPLSQNYLGPAITSTGCRPLVPDHPQMGHSSDVWWSLTWWFWLLNSYTMKVFIIFQL